MTRPPAGLRVVTYNIHSARDDRRALASTVRALAPDVLLLQEAPRRFRWRPRTAALARAYGMVVAGGGMPALGNTILTDLRVAVRHTWVVRFPLTPGRHLRGVVLARCEVAGLRFVAVGSHLSTDPAERPRQARLLAGVAAEAATEAPVVLGVDVNDEPDSPTFAALAEVLVHPAVGPAAGAPTFPARQPRRRLDAVLVDRRVGVLSYRVVDDPTARRASDHLPVVADLELGR